MLKIYGSDICPDCREALEKLGEAGVSYEYHNITGTTAELKEFLALRDHEAILIPVRESGKIGIPCFVKDDGSVTLSLTEAMT